MLSGNRKIVCKVHIGNVTLNVFEGCPKEPELSFDLTQSGISFFALA